MANTLGKLNDIPRTILAHTPTPIDPLPNLSKFVGKTNIYAKRDDCTGLCLGGNKARQLEFYLGAAQAARADTILITGAVQSNFVRMAAAAARKAGMSCHIQLEERVKNSSAIYRQSGNVLLDKLLGARLHSFPEGESETAADDRLEEIAADLRAEGKSPYVIHLGAGHPPLGALGYVIAARELLEQCAASGLHLDALVVGSGSGATHAGLLFGLRALGSSIPVKGICVRRGIDEQRPRIMGHCERLAALLEIDNPVNIGDVEVDDRILAPGYGKMNDAVAEAITLAAHHEGLILDPVYTGRTLAGLLDLARTRDAGDAEPRQNLMFIHTGGQPAIFAYGPDLAPLLSADPI